MINRDDWLTALKEIEAPLIPVDDAITLREFAAVIGRSRAAAQVHMAKLVKAGRATAVVKGIRKSDGHIQYVNAYKLKEADDTRD